MSMLASLTTAALCAAVVAAFVPDATHRRTPGSLAVWPTAVAAAIATVATASAVATREDPAGAALSLLIVALTVVVQAYASRHLRGDPRARAFFVFSTVAAAGSTASIAADDLVMLAAGWSVATLSTLALIATGGAGAQTRVAVRRSAVALLIGDAALWAAVATTSAATGSITLSALGDLGGAPAATAVGTLVAVAAIARAGSFPLHGWLPATAAATTPVSALLHAGFVNAGAVLLLRFDTVPSDTVPSDAGPWIVGIAGATTMLVATLAMRTRPDVKGRLVHSTAAQMGFLLLACALGAYGLALVHAIGHALFKASLFLGAGSALEQALRARVTAPARPARRGAAVGAAVVLAVGLVIASTTPTLVHATAVLLLFPLATATVAGVRIGALSAPLRTRSALLAGLSALVVGYALVIFPAAEALVPAPSPPPLPPAFAIAVFLAAAGIALAARRPGPVADRLFAVAFAWGRPPLPTAPRTPSHRTPSHRTPSHRPLSHRTPAPAGGPLEYRRA